MSAEVNGDADLMSRFRRFFLDLLPLFKLEGEATCNSAREELKEPNTMQLVLSFLRSEESRALIVNVTKMEDGKIKYHFHLDPRQVGAVTQGFTLIKKANFDLSERLRKSFHALSLEPLLERRIDVLLFDELLESLKPGTSEVEDDPNTTLSKDESLSQKGTQLTPDTPEIEAYISIEDPTTDDHGVPLVKVEKTSKIRTAATRRISGYLPETAKEESKKSPIVKKHSTDSAALNPPVSDLPLKSNRGADKSRGGSKNSIDSVRSSVQSIGAQENDPGSPLAKQLTNVQNVGQLPGQPLNKNKSVYAFRYKRQESTAGESETKQRGQSRNRSSSCKHIKAESVDPGIRSPKTPRHRPTDDSMVKDRSESDGESPTNQEKDQRVKQRKQIYVLDSLNDARRGVRLNKDKINEIFYHDGPVSRASELVIQAVCMIMTGKKLSWPKLKLEMRKPTWLKDILELEANKVSEETVQNVMRDFLMQSEWETSGAKLKNAPTKAFAEWVETFCWEHIKTKNGI